MISSTPIGIENNTFDNCDVKTVNVDDVVDVTDKLKNFSGRFEDFKDLHRTLLDKAVSDRKANAKVNAENKTKFIGQSESKSNSLI